MGRRREGMTYGFDLGSGVWLRVLGFGPFSVWGSLV